MRRFDKRKNIMEANLALERSFLINKGLLTETFDYENFMDFDLSEQEYVNVLIESLNENNIEHNIIIKEDKQLLTESWTLLGIGAALASGKIIDLLGSMLRKFTNLFREKKKTEKNWLERKGEELQKKIILVPFRILAEIVLKIAGGISWAYGGELNKATEVNVEKLANTFFYITATILGAKGFMALAESHGLIQFILELTASTTKLYEIVLLAAAIIVIKFGSDKEKLSKFKSHQIAHQLGECIESHGGFRKLVGLMGKKGASDTWECVHKGLESGHH